MAGRLLHHASIRTKVLTLVMLVTTVATVPALAALLAWDYYRFRTDIVRELATQAQMVLENSTAAMSFQDDLAARETLETLAPSPHIQLACLYNSAATLFAHFSRAAAPNRCPATPPPERYRFFPGSVQVVVSTTLAGRPAGSVFLESDLGAITEHARVEGITAAFVLGLTLIVALLLSSVLQRIISEPIDALVHTARDVSERNDYSLRARKTTGDELGVLVDAFNGMLSQIERDEQERAQLLAREREANRLKDEFLMTLSHELRTPLNAILGWTRMLSSGVIPPGAVDKALEKIERNAQAQAKLVEDLLEVSRFTTGKFRLERVPVDLVSIANQAIETVRPQLETRHLTIERQFEVASAPAQGDADRLQQVVWNLLSNAVKFSAIDSRIVVGLRATDGVWELRVQDGGIGIDPAFLPFVFEPFRQGDASSTRAHGGLGLGLSIVRRIVDLHGGAITAASAGAGQGATFTVRLPRVLAAAAPSPSRLPGSRWPAAGDLAGVKVLVVDDDVDTREILTALLASAGAHVRQASAVSDALRLAREFMPDILVSDIAMPDQDGYALLRELRSKHGYSVPRVAIALTAQATPADRDRALEAGFDRHVAKPFNPMQLVDLLREMIADAA